MLVLPNDFELNVTLDAGKQKSGLWFAFAGGELLVRTVGDRVELPIGLHWPFSDNLPVRHLVIGTLEGQPCHAVELFIAEPPPGMRFESLRRLWSRLEDGLLGVAGRAAQLIEWDRSHQFCGGCGVATQRERREYARHCPNCDISFYPRLSPVVMVRVLRDDQILLARAPRFAQGIYSLLAGFVEAGETLEQAIHREVAEEVGICIGNIHYFASQSWPFPHALMIAFTADYLSGTLQVDGREIIDARWFSVDDLPGLPGPMSMARRLIEDYRVQMTQGLSLD